MVANEMRQIGRLVCGYGGIGIRSGLKIQRPHGIEGSTPSSRISIMGSYTVVGSGADWSQ